MGIEGGVRGDEDRWEERDRSNLQRFLDCATPTVEIHGIPKMVGFPHRAESSEYFTLSDLWKQFIECSAYGIGTTVQLQDGEQVVQYYAPYLSGIQIYTTKLLNFSSFGEVNGTDYSNSSEEDYENNEKMSRSWSSVSDDSMYYCECYGAAKKRLGHLYFEYFEACSPYGRVPLAEKISELAVSFPGLMSLKSSDLSPTSWISIFWYPIYHIPYQRKKKDLSACFLTYHTISLSFQDVAADESVLLPAGNSRVQANGRHQLHIQEKLESSTVVPLRPFGLATHRTCGDLWTQLENGDRHRAAALFAAAESWLKQLGVQQPDFNYFITHTDVNV